LGFCRLLKELGIKEEIREIAKNGSAKDVLNVGYDVVYGIFDKATEQNAEDKLYAFLAGPFEITPEQVGSMELTELFGSIKQMAKENDLEGFFKSAAASMK
jgi:hypothetical protein